MESYFLFEWYWIWFEWGLRSLHEIFPIGSLKLWYICLCIWLICHGIKPSFGDLLLFFQPPWANSRMFSYKWPWICLKFLQVIKIDMETKVWRKSILYHQFTCHTFYHMPHHYKIHNWYIYIYGPASLGTSPPPHPMVMGLYSSDPVPTHPPVVWVVVGGGGGWWWWWWKKLYMYVYECICMI